MATMPMSRPLTLEDFEAIRGAADDGHRYELIDGSLIVTPSPSRTHQRVVTRLAMLLGQTNPEPARFEVLVAPLDVRLSELTTVQPDAVVLLDDDDPVPLLALEVLSPSTRHFDVGLKRSRYASAGIAHFWVVDPDAPSLTAWELREGRYVVAAEAVGDQTVTVPTPWPVTITPASLTRRS
ncbi:Uma2 family endonuclease [Ornithinimicrobium faecis]|uniref:Uma2 family endonuclease n=1 Tax=Ornithinimicrobium faecis TaxID=2934158 RepID=UPI002117B072|nr:Uma2 family endonuclease [Ornithinimicrobium sp. HY1745]